MFNRPSPNSRKMLILSTTLLMLLALVPMASAHNAGAPVAQASATPEATAAATSASTPSTLPQTGAETDTSASGPPWGLIFIVALAAIVLGIAFFAPRSDTSTRP